MIKNIKIQSFRGIKSLEINDFKRFNLLLGKNNCGKTSILEALFLSIGITNPVLPRNIHHFRRLILTDTDDFRFMFNKLDFNNEVKIETEVEPDQSRTLLIQPKFSQRLTKNGSQDLIVETSDVSSTSESASEHIEKLILNASIKHKSNGKLQKFQSEISIEEHKFETKLPKNYKESMNGFFINSNTIFQELEQRVENLLVSKKKEILLEPLKFIEPEIRDIALGANSMIYLDLGYPRLVPFNILGDGFCRIFSILSKVLDTRNGIILIDEIENGLHFSSLTIFLKNLLKLAELQNTQLFITTHSKETLRALNEILNYEELEKFKSEIKSFTIRKHEENKIIPYAYDFIKLNHAIEQEIEIR